MFLKYLAYVAILAGMLYGQAAWAATTDASDAAEEDVYQLPVHFELGGHYTQLNLSGEEDADTGAFGASAGVLYNVWDRLYIDSLFTWAGHTWQSEDQTRLTLATGVAWRFDSLPVYPEARLLLGAELLNDDAGWDIDGVVVLGLGVFAGLPQGFSLGLTMSTNLTFEDLKEDPGVFLSLFTTTSRYRSFALVLRWQPTF